MKCKYNSLKEEVASLHKKQDDTDQYSRRMCLRISGISETQNEDVTKVKLDFAKRVNVKIGPGDIDRAHRQRKVKWKGIRGVLAHVLSKTGKLLSNLQTVLPG